MATRTKTFPGVYTQIVDQSFITPTRSRFQLGILGAASKGPFNVPTAIATLGQFVQTFGKPIPDSDTRQVKFFLSDAVAMVADMTDAITVVRVGNTYTDLPVATDASSPSGAGTYVIATGTDNANFVQALLTEGQEVYLSISEGGKFSTVNVQVDSVDNITGTNINLVSIGTPTPDSLAANYVDATIQYSVTSGAAWQAEGVLYAYSYGTAASEVDVPLTAVGNVSGTKNDFQFQVDGDPSGIAVGNLYKIAHANPDDGATTHEVRVSRVVPNILALGATVYLETADITRVGYQALPLQDSYTTGVLYQANTTTSVKIPFLWLRAKTAGDWANGTSSKTGLYVKVRPGSDPGTKKLEVFWDSALVETLDNISDTADATNANSYETIIGNSQYIELAYRYSVGGGQVYHAANTAAPWDTSYYDPQLVTPPISMPFGAINAGIVSNTDRGGQFVGGFNGENAQAADIIGTYDPTADAGTGIKAFEDTDNVQINVLACPMDNIPIEVEQELRRVAKKVNALAIVDVPSGISARQAIDWHNGQGQYTGRGRIDDPNIAVYWNWFQITDPFTGLVKWVPPTLGTIRCMAFTFDRDKPWYAAAGENRGIIPEALAVEFPRVPEDVRQAMYGNGNSVNPILRLRGRFLLYGERTLQRAESKLTAVHSVILVNWVVTGLAEIGRRFVFDPNDLELLVQIRLAFSEYLDKIRNERGIEEYELVVDDRNNNADTRNRREVIVDLAIVPTDVAERIYINATVRESGAQLNSIQ